MHSAECPSSFIYNGGELLLIIMNFVKAGKSRKQTTSFCDKSLTTKRTDFMQTENNLRGEVHSS